MKKTILVSNCLLGLPVRYDGKIKGLAPDHLKRLTNKFRIVGVCPEMLGGLPCPRQPSERDSKGAVHLEDGKDVSIFFLRGAQSTLNICKNYGIEIALLKSKSPSCGFGYIYDGNFTGHLRKGNGVTASFLDENGIEIINEHELESWLNKLKE